MIHKILLVDDEAAITDWVHHLLTETYSLRVDVYKTNHSVDAMAMLEANHFDIAIVDINMPVMDGLAILGEINRMSLATKVIFLTGFQQFEYAREALKNNVAAYVLKNEEDEVLLDAVNASMSLVEEGIVQKGLIELAKQKMDASTPILRREFVVRMLQGYVSAAEINNLEQLPIHLNILRDKPVWVLTGFVAERSRMNSATEAMSMLFAAGLVVEEMLDKYFVYESAMPDESSWVWLLQPKEEEPGQLSVSKLRSVLEHAQTAYNRNTDANLVFVYGSEAKRMEDLSAYYMKLRLLQGYATDGMHAVLTDKDLLDRERETDCSTQQGSDYEPVFRNALFLQKLLERGDSEQYFQVLNTWLSRMEQQPSRFDPAAVETYMTISTLLLSYMNLAGIIEQVTSAYPAYNLLQMNAHVTWKDAADYFRNVSGCIFELQHTKRKTYAWQHIYNIKVYISEHLDEDLSLIRLANMANLNPSYFSNLFKSVTGMNPSEVIKQERLAKAKDLLADNKYRINEIARKIGFANPAYFTKFFKSETGWSPQEYRNQQLPINTKS